GDDADEQDGRVPHHVDAGRRVEQMREEGIGQMADGIRTPTQVPDRLFRVAAVADPRVGRSPEDVVGEHERATEVEEQRTERHRESQGPLRTLAWSGRHRSRRLARAEQPAARGVPWFGHQCPLHVRNGYSVTNQYPRIAT